MRRCPALPATLVLTLVGGGGCVGPPPEVVIDTRVGAAQAESELERLRTTTTQLATITSTWWSSRGSSNRAPDTDTDASAEDDDPANAELQRRPAKELRYEPVPPGDAEAFAAQVAALREGPIDEVGTLARNLAESEPAVWPEVSAVLLAERERPKREYKQVLTLIGGDVPNRYGHFALHWKQAHGYDVRVSEDWFEDLLGLSPKRISKPLRPVYRDALLTVALLRAAANIARTQTDPAQVETIVGRLLDAGYVHDGTFRDEVGRAIDGVGDRAIPHLLRESVAPEDADEDSVEERRAAYATYCLDRMDRLHPSRAIEAAASDRRLLANVLSAYGRVREGEAAPLILDWVDADAPGVRAAAREAFEAYVTGPLPKIRRKAIRLYGGATSTQRAELSYREHARLAIRARLGALAPDLLEAECELWQAGGLVDPDCEAQPERLYRAYLGLLDARRAEARDALIARALASEDRVAGAAMLDTLLTDGGDDLAPDLVAPYYAKVATELEGLDRPAEAAALLRKSAMLLADADPARARDLRVDALLLEASVDGVDERGRQMLLNTARDLSPDSPTVSAALIKLDDERGLSSARPRERLRNLLLGLLAGLGGLLWFSTLIHRPRPRRQPEPSQAS